MHIAAHGHNQAMMPRYQTHPQRPSESGVGSSSHFISIVRVNMVCGWVGTSRRAATLGVDMVGG
jgi:hypothetical protein